MANGVRLKRVGLVVATIAAVTAPGVALAATTPKAGHYISPVVRLAVASTRKSMKVQNSRYCNSWTIKNVPINHGKFSFTGSASNGAHATVSGSFVTAKEAKGTVKVGRCAKKSFTAQYSGGY